MGINRYVLMDKLPYDQIHHIDMHLKLLDEETLLVGEYPPGIADGPQIEQNLAYVVVELCFAMGRPLIVSSASRCRRTRWGSIRIPVVTTGPIRMPCLSTERCSSPSTTRNTTRRHYASGRKRCWPPDCRH